MAHSRRAETSYEEHVEDCFDNRRSVIEEEQRVLREEQDMETTGEVGMPRTPMFEVFALRCRWGRVECLVGEGIVSILCGHTAVGATLRAAETKAENDSCSRAKDKDGASGLALQAASISLEILHAICHLCDKDQITRVTLEIMKIWSACTWLLEDAEDDSLNLLRSQKGGLSCGWWKVIAEMCRRSRDFALWLCEGGPDNIISKCLILVLRTTDEALVSVPPSSGEGASEVTKNRQADSNEDSNGHAACLQKVIVSQRQSRNSSVWAMRVWRLCLVYGKGARSISELLLAAQLERYISLPAGAHTHSLGTSSGKDSDFDKEFSHGLQYIARAVGPGIVTRMLSPLRLTEIMWLLEQSAVTCAAVVNTHTMKVAQRSHKVGDVAASQKTLHTTPPCDRQEELKDEEMVGIALETARLLLGAAERLLPVVLRSCSRIYGESKKDSWGDLSIDLDSRLLLSASLHFLSSFLGSWQATDAESSHHCDAPVKSSQLLALYELECYSLRQHQLQKARPEVGLGLLQSCLQYAQYVRTASSDESLETQQVKTSSSEVENERSDDERDLFGNGTEAKGKEAEGKESEEDGKNDHEFIWGNEAKQKGREEGSGSKSHLIQGEDISLLPRSTEDDVDRFEELEATEEDKLLSR